VAVAARKDAESTRNADRRTARRRGARAGGLRVLRDDGQAC
jgi:hypothetical protein